MIDRLRKLRYILSMRAYLLRQQGLKLLGNLGELFLRLCICVVLGALGVYFLEYFGVVKYRKVAPKVIGVWDRLRGTGNLVEAGKGALLVAKGEPLPEEASRPKPKKPAVKREPDPLPDEDELDGDRPPVRKRREFVKAKTFLAAEDYSRGSRNYGVNTDAAGGILRKFDSIPFGQGALEDETTASGRAKAARRKKKQAEETGWDAARGAAGAPGVKGKQSPVMGTGARDLILPLGKLEDEADRARWEKAEAERLANEEFWRKFSERMAIGGLISLVALIASFFLSGLFSLLRDTVFSSVPAEGNFKDFNFRPNRKSDSGRGK